MRCAARCRARALVLLPVFDRAFVSALSLEGELALGLAHRLVGRPDAAPALELGGAGLRLEATHLLLRQRGLREGVVLAAREQAPEQARELASAGDDGDRMPAARPDALIEAGDRSRLAHRRPAGLDERVTGAGRALLGDVPVRGGRGSGLADARIETEVRLSGLLCVRPGRLLSWSVGESVSEVDFESSEGVGPVVGPPPFRFGSPEREVDELGGGLF